MTRHLLAHSSLAFLGVVIAASLAPGQPKEPPRAEKLDIQIRYRIRADRDERIRQFRLLEKHLADLGFVDANREDTERELDPAAERFTGTIPSAKVMEVLRDPRVLQILFAPSGFAYPDAPDKPVAVKLGLRTGYQPPVQQKLHEQVVAHLGQLGFVESLGYDTRGYALVRGSIPLKSLELLVKDIRTEPSGWFLADTPLHQLPAPLRDANPLVWAEVVPVPESAPPFAPPPVLPAQLKYSADLRVALLDPGRKDAPIRVEALFLDRVTDIEGLRTLVQGRYAGASLDGVIGNVVSIRFPRPSYVERFADEPGVIGLRLPREAWETVAQGGKGVAPADAIQAARLNELHKLGYRGAGVRVVLIGSDFSGAEKLVGTELPKNTKVVDLTVQLTPELVPAKADPARLGTGTAAAKALAAVAPECDLVLVRIDPGNYFSLDTVVRLARGELQYTEALRLRLAELADRSAALDRDRAAAISAYKAAFSDLTDNAVAAAARKKAKEALEAVLEREKKIAVYVNRFNAYQKEISTVLVGATVFVNTLVWESGYPLDGLNEFAGRLDRLSANLPPRIVKRAGDPAAAPPAPIVWVQAASHAGASVWGGPFLDANRDGLMEFVRPGTKLPADNWSPQLNFLGTRAPTGEVSPEIAKDARLRFVVQWREPADPKFPETDTPVHPLTLRLLRQIDPTGTQRASDEMQEVARSVSTPNVIFRTRTFLVFEQMLEYTVPDAGRFALAIESPRAATPLLPALKRELEIWPRVVLETRGAAAGEARAVFRSYTNFVGGVGTPGDAHGAITVGIEGDAEQFGAGTGVTLRGKPDLIGPPALAFGAQNYTGQGTATAFAGGAAALLVQARASGPNVFQSAKIEAGKKLELPETWLKVVPPPPTRRRP